MVTVCGLDIGRNHAVVASLNHFPTNIQRYYSQHKREFIRLSFDEDGFQKLWEMLPDVVVLEPTGRWYSRLVAEKCTAKGIEVCWVGHCQLKSQRESYGFKSKRDPEDALSLAACYFDERFVDVHGRKRFLQFNPDIEQLRDWFGEWEQLDKVENSLVNHIRQRLCYEVPEIASQKLQPGYVNKKLQAHPLWCAIAGIHTYKHFRDKVDNTIGAGLSDYTRRHAMRVVELQRDGELIKSKCLEFLSQPEFAPYLEAMEPFKFGVKNQVGLLIQIYPFDKFLVDGQRWIERRISRNGKRVKCDRSLRSFQGFLGLSFVMEQSGDSGKTSKRFTGSKICRSHLYMWAKNEFDKQRGKRVTSEQGKILWEKHRDLRRLEKVDGENRYQSTEGAIGGDDAIIRLLFRTTSELYKNLCKTILG